MRASSKVLDFMIESDHKVPVGPDGFVRIVDYMGNQDSIVQAARVSYGKGTKTPSDDRSLVRYLLRHWHTTPFEMCVVKFHVRMEIFTARQHFRHRMSSANEYSGRYSEMIDEMFWVGENDWRLQSGTNKQGSGGHLTEWPEDISLGLKAAALSGRTPGEYLSTQQSAFQDMATTIYQERLELGVAREQARIDLPLSNYTEFYWKVDLHNLMNFLRLRLDSHAQQEIRAFAQAMADYVKLWLPNVWEAFEDYRLNQMSFSGEEVLVLAHLLHNSNDDSSFDPERVYFTDPEKAKIAELTRLSKREIGELQDKLVRLRKEYTSWVIRESTLPD